MEVNARGRKPAAERGGRSWGAVWASTDKEVWSCWVCLLLHLQCSGCLLCAVCSSCAAQEDGFLPWGPVAGLGLSSCAGMARCHLGHSEVPHADMVKDMARCSSGQDTVRCHLVTWQSGPCPGAGGSPHPRHFPHVATGAVCPCAVCQPACQYWGAQPQIRQKVKGSHKRVETVPGSAARLGQSKVLLSFPLYLCNPN